MESKTKAAAGLASSPLADYRSVADWQKEFGGAVFETRASVEWFIKINRVELIKKGALVPREGRSGSLLHSQKFAAVAESIFKRAALDRLKH